MSCSAASAACSTAPISSRVLRDLYKLKEPSHARERLASWLAWASRCRIPAFVRLSRTIRKHREGILAAIGLGLSNSKLEGLASKIHLINHRG